MRVGVRDFMFLFSLTLIWLELASGVLALDSQSHPVSDPLIEIATQVTQWSNRCAEMEKTKPTIDARECWWRAAKAINRFTVGSHPFVGEVKRLRMDWLWRALQLVLEANESDQRGEMKPHFSSGVDPTRIVGPPACSSIVASDYKQCFGTTTGGGSAIAHRRIETAPTYNSAAINKKNGELRVSKTKLETTRPKVLRKKAKATPSKKVVALPIVQKVSSKRNFARTFGWESGNAGETPRDCWCGLKQGKPAQIGGQ
jgi:hypothetical protein